MRLLRPLAALLTALLSLQLAAMALTALPTRSPADVVVVLGNTVNPDGTPSPRLRARLEAGLGLYREGLAGRVLVSGGTGKEGPNEAEVMRDWLVAQGVPAEDVRVDRSGDNTRLTAEHTCALLEDEGLRTVAVATSWFHVLRTRLALGRCGAVVVGARASRFAEWRDVWSVPREVVAFWAYLS